MNKTLLSSITAALGASALALQISRYTNNTLIEATILIIAALAAAHTAGIIYQGYERREKLQKKTEPLDLSKYSSNQKQEVELITEKER